MIRAMGYNPNPERRLSPKQRLLIVAVCWAIAIPLFVMAWDLWWFVILLVAAVGVWLSRDYVSKGGMAESVESAAKESRWLMGGLSHDREADR